MNLHEYQSKRLFGRYAIPVPRGLVAESPDQAAQAATDLGGERLGGQGPGPRRGARQGGRRGAGRQHEQVAAKAQRLLGTRLYTRQTGPRACP